MCQAAGKQTETEKADGGRRARKEEGRERWRAEKDKEVEWNGGEGERGIGEEGGDIVRYRRERER